MDSSEERNESCRNDYHQSLERVRAEIGVKLAMSCSQVPCTVVTELWSLAHVKRLFYLITILVVQQNGFYRSIIGLTLYSIYTHSDASTPDSFRKHCGKRRNCSLQAISPFPLMFSTRSDKCILICPYF